MSLGRSGGAWQLGFAPGIYFGDIFMTAKSMIMAAAIAATTFVGSAGMASAHSKHFFFDHHPRVVLLFGNGGCSYYRDMWYDTGRFYWKEKYYVCKGWW
jgi:hypothetical protein